MRGACEMHVFPTLKIKNKYDNIDDYKFEDFEIENYKHLEPIKMDMIAQLI